MLDVTMRNFRCFKEKQTVRLAPLTLLVGDNCTGKTSFLALLRALWDVAFEGREANFKAPPYDLGSFSEIVHSCGTEGERPSAFEAGFLHENPRSNKGHKRVRFTMRFEADRSAPRLACLRAETEGAEDDPPARRIHSPCWAAFRMPGDGSLSFRVGTPNGEWELRDDDSESPYAGMYDALTTVPKVREGRTELPSLNYYIGELWRMWKAGVASPHMGGEGDRTDGDPPTSRSQPTTRDWHALVHMRGVLGGTRRAVYAGAATRAEPRRSYDPGPVTGDPAGSDFPMYLHDLSARGDDEWTTMKTALEDFGRSASLFEEIRIRTAKGWEGGPFQVQIRRDGIQGGRGSFRNLIDEGYGLSQVLPVIAELRRPPQPRLFLLQQPEAHLHPSAEAALGSLFGAAAAAGSQLVVETHSDHLIDRIRTDARDGVTKLRPGDVSILYFERDGGHVRVHSLGWDDNGNLAGHGGDIPDGYREFFRTETRKSLGL